MRQERYTTNSQKTRSGAFQFAPDPAFAPGTTITAASPPFWHPGSIGGSSMVLASVGGSGNFGISLDAYVVGNGPFPYTEYVVVVKATNGSLAAIAGGFSVNWMILQK